MESEYIAKNGKQIITCLKVLYCEGIDQSKIESYENNRGKLCHRIVFSADKSLIDKINNELYIHNS